MSERTKYYSARQVAVIAGCSSPKVRIYVESGRIMPDLCALPGSFRWSRDEALRAAETLRLDRRSLPRSPSNKPGVA